MKSVTGKPVVYLLTCQPTGKQYVGIAKNSAEQRFKKHCSVARRGSDLLLHSAIRKYGASNFTLATIAFVDTWNEAQNMERKFISEYDTLTPAGFNMTHGGEGTVDYKHTDAARASMSAKHKGKIISSETRKRMSKGLTGIKRSEEFKSESRARQIGKPRNPDIIKRLHDGFKKAVIENLNMMDGVREANRRRTGIKQDPAVVAARVPAIRVAMTVASVRAKIVASNKRRRYSAETRKKMSTSLRIALARPEVKMKMAAANSSRVWTPEARAKMSEAKKGKPRSTKNILNTVGDQVVRV